MSGYKKKLIEVALPLEAINRESAREKSIRHGHPSTLHLWWARRPLAACRAVLFAQLVDDPSAHPDKFPTDEAQAAERQRLFGIIERLVVWENINDETLLKEAHEEILKSTDGNPPAILDPFAGGGSIPLEAQRLGLEAYASDLNPVAVLINKALIEIPPKWAGQPPVFPGAAEVKMTWPGSTGLAEDVRRYGQWMREQAELRIGHLYPKVTLPDGSTTKAIAWIWARTVTCPNPACGVQMPLVRSWWLGKKKGKEAFIQPRLGVGGDGSPVLEYGINFDVTQAPSKAQDGTIGRTGAVCAACRTAVPLTYIRAEGVAHRMNRVMMAVVAEGDRRRIYMSPTPEDLRAAQILSPDGVPDGELADNVWDIKVKNYGLTQVADLFTERQQVTLCLLSDLVSECHALIKETAVAAWQTKDAVGAADRASAYADAVALYLGLLVGKQASYLSAHCVWGSDPKNEGVMQVFSRQALPMVWDFAETNPFSDSSGNFNFMLRNVERVLENLPDSEGMLGQAVQADARTADAAGKVVSTDPPYYDNIGYANLSDFYYVWLRKSLKAIFPELLATLVTPKTDELVADPYRHGSRSAASAHFESGFERVFGNLAQENLAEAPVTVYYAFRQSESDEAGSASTGWQTLLEGMLRSGWEVTATWPLRTERSGRMLSIGTNALASSIVLALRPRHPTAEMASRRTFGQALKTELPHRLRELQQGDIAPVDLAQAAIGPGMAVFSRYSGVLEADGSLMTVRTALALINQALDEVLVEQEGDFDAETRFAVKWFSQFGWNEAPSGDADVLTRAVNTTVAMLERGGIFRAAAGKARLLAPSEMSDGWSPASDRAISVWEVAVRLAHALITEGTDRAAVWMRASAARVDLDAVKELAYLMYSVCERKGWAESAMLFNALGTSWSEVSGASRVAAPTLASQGALDFGDDDE